jgi:hypothetical protein
MTNLVELILTELRERGWTITPPKEQTQCPGFSREKVEEDVT